MSAITDIIDRVAQALGVDPKLAEATAQQESGFNPNAIGDGGHSVGLFQLNDRGEGAGMTVAQRQDPETNARIALTQIHNVAVAHPDWSPGHIAAAAQRPADQVGYARSVDAIYAASGGATGGGGGGGGGGLLGSIPSPGDLLGGAKDLIDQFNPVTQAQNFASAVGSDIINGLFKLAVYGVLLAAGAGLIVMGGWKSVSSSPAAGQAKSAATMAAMA